MPVSIVMPAYNAAPYLEQAVETARRQDWPALELIAVDDGSTDATGEILQDLAGRWTGPGRSARVLRQDNAGAGAARNAGMAAASHDIVALLDADDIYEPDLISACMGRLLAHDDVDLVFGLTASRDIHGARRAQPPLPDRLDALDLLDGRMVNRPVLRRAAATAVGGHDPSLKVGIDLDLFLRMALARPRCIMTVPRVLSEYRRHPGQITADWRRVRQGWLKGRDTFARARPDVPRRRLDKANARKCLYWTEIAYAAGDYAGARKLFATAVRHVPREALGSRHGWIRAASCLASALPEALHQGIRRRFNARREV